MTPINALVSGPMAGGNWEPGDNAPRSIAQWYWEEVCPEAERTIITSNDAKAPVRWHEGKEVFEHYVKLLKDTPGRCVEFTASEDDGFPQLFDLWLVGDPRGVSMSELFLHTATSRLLGPSDVVSAAIARNMGKFLPRGPRPAKASPRAFERTMAVHIRRGDFGPACKDRALWASTYYQWCVRFFESVGAYIYVVRRNMFPTLPDKFVVPPGSGGGNATDAAKEVYRHHCYPTDDETLAAIRRARHEYTAANPDRYLDVLYVLTNADAAWVRTFAATMRKEGWGTVLGTPDLVLDPEQFEVGMAVDMEIARRAEVFIGNGVRVLVGCARCGRVLTARSGRRSRATSCMGGSSIRSRRSRTGSGEGWSVEVPWNLLCAVVLCVLLSTRLYPLIHSIWQAVGRKRGRPQSCRFAPPRTAHGAPYRWYQSGAQSR
jgi:hypothetical protein